MKGMKGDLPMEAVAAAPMIREKSHAEQNFMVGGWLASSKCWQVNSHLYTAPWMKAFTLINLVISYKPLCQVTIILKTFPKTSVADKVEYPLNINV